ncbi:hypothetical protein K438DRAFT_5273 [Mycena galopus ATCC 62051]|nr:hypothetical protein K438DRAFT_5273 [Mycena galopus ATCC 62051]
MHCFSEFDRRQACSDMHPVLRVAVIRTLARPSQLRAPLGFRRCIQSEAAQGHAISLEILASTIKDLTAAHQQHILVLLQDLTAAHQDLKSAINEANRVRIDALRHVHVNEGLRIKLEKARNNLSLRSAIEMIRTTLQERHKILKLSNPVQGSGVQKVIDTIAVGGFNDGNVTFEDAKNTVVKELTARGGIKTPDVGRALGVLYAEISKHHHTGVTESLTVRQGEQTLAEAIAIMSIILFARRVYGSVLNAAYYDSNNKFQFTLSTLPL